MVKYLTRKEVIPLYTDAACKEFGNHSTQYKERVGINRSFQVAWLTEQLT